MPETVTILIVEDNQDDILLMQRAFQKADINNPIENVRTGEEAVAYLNGEGKYSNRSAHPLPALVLLDLHLPGMDGFELLSWIRQHDTLRALPVIVLTSSGHIRDVNKAYSLGANSFFIKETDFSRTVELAGIMHQHWLKTKITPENFRPQHNPEWWEIIAPSTSSG